jgi:hypothetical protein
LRDEFTLPASQVQTPFAIEQANGGFGEVKLGCVKKPEQRFVSPKY